jgi:hypothetical protein
MRRSSFFTTPDDKFVMNGYMNNAALGGNLVVAPWYSDGNGETCTLTFSNTGNQWQKLDYTSPAGQVWSLSDINSLQILLGRQNSGSADLMKLFRAYADVSYYQYPNVLPAIYRTYESSNSIENGQPLSDYNTPGKLSERGEKFILRMGLMNQTGERWLAGFGSLKLQYSRMSSSSCTTQSTGWMDVSSNSPGMRFYVNPSVDNGSPVSIVAGDILDIPQSTAHSYVDRNDFTTSQDATGLYSIWDFSLMEDPQNPGGSYCFRLLPASPIVYTPSPQMNAQIETLSSHAFTDFVDNNANSLDDVSIDMSAIIANGRCQTATGTLGTATQKLSIYNGSSSNGWSMSIAPTLGDDAKWMSTDQQHSYSFNNSSGFPAGCDENGNGGQLTVRPSNATITPWTLCSNNGISLSPDAAFGQGSSSAITIATGSSSVDQNCSWMVDGVDLSQKIPGSAKAGSYTLDLTQTIVAS